jgi:hypothetical protein
VELTALARIEQADLKFTGTSSLNVASQYQDTALSDRYITTTLGVGASFF